MLDGHAGLESAAVEHEQIGGERESASQSGTAQVNGSAKRPLGILKMPTKAAHIGETEDTSGTQNAFTESSTVTKQHQQEELQRDQRSSISAFETAAKSPEHMTSFDREETHAASLPPEILSLFNKRDTRHERLHSRQVSKQSTPRARSEASDPTVREQNENRAMERVWNLATVDAAPIIMLPKNFQPKEGSKLSEDLIVGKHLSSGLQGGVYDLLKPDGSEAQVVLKWVHNYALLAEVEREWEVGMRLNQLAYQDGSLPGFMGVGAGVRGGGKFRGMLLEKLNGTTVDKVVCTRGFHDVRYIYDMLYSVFAALDRAQGALGFHHSDLRLANVMEIVLPNSERSQGSKSQTSSQHRRQGSGQERRESLEMNGRTADMQQPPPTRSKETDLSEPPPEHCARNMFKIIDYGLADFEETFAAGPDVQLEDEKNQESRRSINLHRQNSISPANGCVAAFPFPMMNKKQLSKLPNSSPIEKLYRFMWRRKGDVYHLVFELGEWLDGRVWPEEDELNVLRLVDLIHHVTGVKIKAFFSNEMTGEDSVAGWRDQACGPFERHDSAMHFLRRWNIRLRSWLNPSNPGLTAAEALTAPFFTKRISLRGVIHGASTRYSKWTRAPSKRIRKHSAAANKAQ